MAGPDYIPENYKRIAIVRDGDSLFRDEFEGKVNCFLQQRRLSGDFNALARELYPVAKTWHEQKFMQHGAIYRRLGSLAEGQTPLALAARGVKADYDMLQKRGFNAELRTIDHEYYNCSQTGLHMDGAPQIGGPPDRMGTVLCAYTKPTTAWARNGDCDGGLRIYAPMNPALIFTLKAGAKKFHFEPGDLVRMAFEHNKNGVKGFIHCAEPVAKGELRLLLLARYSP